MQRRTTTTIVVGVLGAALAATVFMAMGGMLDLITQEQKVYAPSSRRGPTCDYRAMTGMYDNMPEFPIMNSWN